MSTAVLSPASLGDNDMASAKTHYAILRVRKLKSVGSISGSAQHTFRERPTANANPSWGNNCTVGADNTHDLIDTILAKIDTADKRAPNPVMALEYLVTATPEAMRDEASADSYLCDALNWLRDRHGHDNVVSSTIHRDESTCSHLVAYVVPLVHREARRRKRSVIVGKNPDGSQRRETRLYDSPAHTVLSASHFLDGRKKLADMQTDFAKNVGTPHGLNRGVRGSTRRHQRVQRGYAQERVTKPSTVSVPKMRPPTARELIAPADYVARQQAAVDRYRQESEREHARLCERIACQQREIDARNMDRVAYHTNRLQQDRTIGRLWEERRMLLDSVRKERQGSHDIYRLVLNLLMRVRDLLANHEISAAYKLVVAACDRFTTILAKADSAKSRRLDGDGQNQSR